MDRSCFLLFVSTIIINNKPPSLFFSFNALLRAVGFMVSLLAPLTQGIDLVGPVLAEQVLLIGMIPSGLDLSTSFPS